jgi:pimeloyl-ACP methyl ester carboxylesterase
MSDSLPRVTRHFIDLGTTQAHLRQAGKDSAQAALVCLHMVPKSSRTFARVLPWLARDRLVVAPDLPGYGESDVLDQATPVSVEDYADFIWAVLDRLGLKSVSFIGYHTGSMVAVAATRQRPDRVQRLINISAPVLTREEVGSMLEFFRPIPLDEEGTRFRVMWERILRFRGPDMNLEMCAESMADNLRGGEQYEEGHRAAFENSARYQDSLGRIEQPLLVMNIRDDLYEHSRRVDPLLRNGERRDYPQWANGFLEASPEAVAREMLGFLNADR